VAWETPEFEQCHASLLVVLPDRKVHYVVEDQPEVGGQLRVMERTRSRVRALRAERSKWRGWR